MNDWGEDVMDAFENFVKRKYSALGRRVKNQPFLFDTMVDTYGFALGTRKECSMKAKDLRDHVMERVVSLVWGRV